MREVHAQLREHAGERDPLAKIASEWTRHLRVLVLDEFFVSDIGDAMLLGRLLERLFAEGVVLVTSSNTAPTASVQGRPAARALPACDRADAGAHASIVLLDSPNDYRLRALTRSPVYRAPLDAQSDAWLAQRWQELTAGLPQDPARAARAVPRDRRPRRSPCAPPPRAMPGSTSPRCARARARPATTSRSRPSTTRCCSAAFRSSTTHATIPRAASCT